MTPRSRRSSARALERAAWALSLVLAAEIGGLGALVASATAEGSREAVRACEAHEVGLRPASDIEATAPRAVPLLFQEDERWAGLPYATAEGTVASHGCGLVAASMAASYFAGREVAPPELLAQVGNSCTTGGVNDMGKFCVALAGAYEGVWFSGQLWTSDEALEYVRAGALAFAGMSGQLVDGGKDYGGHVVLVYRVDDSGVWVRDPDDEGVTEPMALERFEQVNFTYFYAIGAKA